jgi:hypothetical protein
LRGDRRDQHCVASQAVWRSEKMSLILTKRPDNGGLLRISHQSPGYDFEHFLLRHRSTGLFDRSRSWLLYSAFAEAFLAFRRIDFAARLRWLLDLL